MDAGSRYHAGTAQVRKGVVNCNCQMTTFERLQMLNDAEFHRLADGVLRRIHPRFGDLRTHGLNDAGQSIKGQPDSYVGISASACTIAFCYTTDRKDWWNKVVSDVAEAAKTSPVLQEIVVAIPRDVDRDGPNEQRVDWSRKATDAAGKAKLTIYDGRRLSKHLDEDCQDVRCELLGIPFSRLSYEAILLSCQRADRDAIDDLKAKGRYNPEQYVVRESDGEFRRLWREAFTSVNERPGKSRGRLIPLVNDSGFGKTSLLCSFVEAIAEDLPMLLIQARDCRFDSEDALVRIAIQKLQGVLDPALWNEEEVSLSRQFTRPRSLTVVLDGIDETRKAAEVASAIGYWLDSRLGTASILIVSSRPDFWRRCWDNSWERCLPASGQLRDDRGSPTKRPELLESRRTEFAILQPFTTAELRAAWTTSGLHLNALDQLPHEVQLELRHPFTFRACAEVLKSKGSAALPRTRAEMIALWLELRLHTERDLSLRLSAAAYWKALTEIARSIQSADSSAVSVDALVNVPRFDPAKPPGVVVERLIEANVLETLDGKPDTLRFVFDSVFEFFAAEADIEEIRGDSQSAVASLMKKSLSTTATRVSRIGAQIGGTPAGDEFLRSLIRQDYARGLLALQACPQRFSAEVKRLLFEEVRQNFWRARRPEMAFIIERLGYLDCDEARDLLQSFVLPWEGCPYGLHHKAAESVIRLNLVSGVSLVASVITHGYPYYFSEVLSLLMGTSAAFRGALTERALTLLEAESDTPAHMRAVSILAYLGDAHLVEHLRKRLAAKRLLCGYENHALLALGSEEAGELYFESARRTAAAIARNRDMDASGAGSAGLFWSLSPRSTDIRYLITPPFERYLVAMISDPDEIVSHVGVDLALFSRKPGLVRHVVFTCKHDAVLGRRVEVGNDVAASEWVRWWKEAPCDSVRQSLLSLSGSIPDIRIENAAIEGLQVPKLRGAAAGALGRLGSIRCLPALRAALTDCVGDEANDWWHKCMIANALGQLRDPAAVGLLEDLALTPLQVVQEAALESLARTRTETSEEALLRLSNKGDASSETADELAMALTAHGSRRCVSKAIELAQQRTDGPRWLAEQMRHAFLSRGWTVGEYYTHVQDDELIPYIMSGEAGMTNEEKRNLVGCVEQIDSENARRLLRELASRAGTQQDTVVRNDGLKLSFLALDELKNRGDAFAINYFVSRALNRDVKSYFLTMEEMSHFAREAVRSEVKERLATSPAEPVQVARLLSLLGLFGGPGDVEIVEPYLGCAAEPVRNVSYEAKVRLTDPLRLAARWQEILIE